MKRIWISFVIVIIFVLLLVRNHDFTKIKNGMYVLSTQVGFSPCVTITDHRFSINDLLSSNSTKRVSGTYAIDDDMVTMSTDDGKNIYIFRIDGDKLIFNKDDSSSMNLINDRVGDKIEDNAVFCLLGD